MCRKIFFALVLLRVSMSGLHAQCLGSCSSTGCNTEAASCSGNSEQGNLKISLGYSVLNYEPFADEQLLTYSTPTASVYTVTSQQVLKASVEYQFGERWSSSVSLPYNLSFNNKE